MQKYLQALKKKRSKNLKHEIMGSPFNQLETLQGTHIHVFLKVQFLTLWFDLYHLSPAGCTFAPCHYHCAL